MGSKLVPQLWVESIYELTPALLGARQIRALLLDLDNTLTPYHVTEPAPELLAWRDELEQAGIRLFIVSNSRSGRAAEFAERFGLDYMDHAGKPRPGGILRAVSRCGVTRAESALVGDQIFTDVWGARRAGVLAILTRPISLKHPFRALRYAVESPFRWAGKRRGKP